MRGTVTRLLALRLPHDTQGVLTGVQVVDKSQCSPRYKTEREIVPNHFQLGCAERAIDSRYDEGAVVSTCCHAIPFFGDAVLSMCHALSIAEGGQHGHPMWKQTAPLPLPAASLTIVQHKPSIGSEQATSSYSFRFSELSQPI
jgi:hypothetical protein